MSVMACNRKGCTHVMSRWYSNEFGYMCDECKEELLNSSLTILKFMELPKERTEEFQHNRLRDFLHEFRDVDTI